MKEFFVGLIFLIMVCALAGVAILLSPFLFALGVILQVFVYILFVIFAIWLLGKVIVLVWESIRGEKK